MKHIPSTLSPSRRLAIVGGLVLALGATLAYAQQVSAPAVTPALQAIALKNGQTLDWPSVTFKPMCGENGCGAKKPPPRFKPKDICVVAKCIPLEANAIKSVLPPNVEHWRIYPNNTMALFRGDTPMLATVVAATVPFIDASKTQVQHTPVLVQADEKGQPVKYWVRVAK